MGVAKNQADMTPAPGGIGVLSTSRDVEIIGCHIEGGWGHGIGLGHAVWVNRTEDEVTAHASIQAALDKKPLGFLQNVEGGEQDWWSIQILAA
ncbi:MAG: hypothetical protein HC927_01520 [Deltaproteobacteria bacterium]|nr:hypothetical protein [Deltaproteobacteria bacterium]